MIRIRIGTNEQSLSWEEWESRVLDGRIAPDCPVQMDAVTGEEFVPARDLELYQSLVQDGAVAWRRSFTSSGPPVLTALLVGVQIRIWWWARLPDFAETLINDFAKWGPAVYEKGESWRLLTMGFVHIETFHLALNMMWLAYTGWNLERALGRLNLFTLFIASVVGGSLCSLLGAPGSMSVGASGGVFGLVAASVVFGFLRPELLSLRAQNLYGAALLPYLILMLLSGLTSEGTDNWSHIGGLITGGVLAFLLDPEPLQRRPRWNQKIQSLVAVVCTACLLLLAGAGTRIYPLVDSETARWSHLDAVPVPTTLVDPALRYNVPSGWQAGQMVSGEPGFRSPLGDAGFGVRVGVTEFPLAAEEAAANWRARMLERFPGAEIEASTSAVVGGHDGLAVAARSTSGETLVEWRVAVKGCWMLEEVWESSSKRQVQLDPLLHRLRASVSWGEPSPLTNARLAFEQLPNSLNIRISLARALAEAGYVSESLERWRELRTDHADNALVRSGYLEVIRWYPESVKDLDQELQTLLETENKSATMVDLVATLERLGRHEQAIGLLEVAWTERPGDRTLKRARRNRGMWTSLSETSNRPFAHEFDLTSPSLKRYDFAQTELNNTTFEGLQAVGEAYVQTRRTLAKQLSDSIPDDPTSVVRALVLLKLGKPPEDAGAYAEGIQEDLLASDWPDWMQEIRDLGVDKDDVNEALIVVTADPGELPKFSVR